MKPIPEDIAAIVEKLQDAVYQAFPEFDDKLNEEIDALKDQLREKGFLTVMTIEYDKEREAGQLEVKITLLPIN